MGIEGMILAGLEKKTHYKEIAAKIVALASKLAPVASLFSLADLQTLLEDANAKLGNKLTPAQIQLILSVGQEIVAELKTVEKAAEGLG